MPYPALSPYENNLEKIVAAIRRMQTIPLTFSGPTGPIPLLTGAFSYTLNLNNSVDPLVVNASATYYPLRIGALDGSPLQFQVGAAGQVAGIYSTVKSHVDSNANSVVYGGVFQAYNAGPGTVKGIHVDAIGVTGSTGGMVGANVTAFPVATNGVTVNYALQIGVSGPDDSASGIFFSTATNTRYRYAIGNDIQTIKVKYAWCKAMVDVAGSDPAARVFTFTDEGGIEHWYVKLDGTMVAPTVIGGSETAGLVIQNSNIFHNNTGGNITIASGTGGGTALILNAANHTEAVIATNSINLLANATNTTGGAAGQAVMLGGGGGALGIYFGNSAPTLSAPQGSLYLRTDGSSSSTRMYVNTNGSTTWTNVVTAA